MSLARLRAHRAPALPAAAGRCAPRAARACVALAAAVVVAALPAIAHACAACGVGNGRNTAQFWWTTVVLSLLPLGLLAGGMLWIARHGRAFIAAEFRESDEPAETPGALPGAPLPGNPPGR